MHCRIPQGAQVGTAMSRRDRTITHSTEPLAFPCEDGAVGYILCERGDLVCIVDLDDWHRFKQYKWDITPRKQTYYARTFYEGYHYYLHREIMGLETGDPRHVDHRNDDGLDCRKDNLRVSTIADNVGRANRKRGKTGYIGVEEHAGKFVAKAARLGKRVYIGRYDTAEQAARAYDAHQRSKLGSIARLNFPEDAA